MTTFNIAGVSFNDFHQICHTIQVGDSISFARELDNKYDPRAVALYYKGVKIGYVPKGYNLELDEIESMVVEALSTFDQEVVGARIIAVPHGA